MSIPPRTYRLYCFDLQHKAVTADFLKVATDEEAIASAKACAASKCEVWEGKRLVAALDQERRHA